MKANILAIQKLVDCINSNPEKAPSASEASQRVNYERAYFSKLFKRTTGITYSDYCAIIKMGFAAAELRDTKKSVFEIADMLGYSGPEAFTHAFTNVFGCSPANYRRNPNSISVPFYKIVRNNNKGVITMKKIEPANVIGDNFLKLLSLQPISIIMYCFLASFAVSPTGMLQNYNPKGNILPCIEISSSVAEMLPFSIDEIFLSIIELADVDLLTIVNMENNGFHIVINPIPEVLTSNGLLDGYIDFIDALEDR